MFEFLTASWWGVLIAGFLLGLKHATESDHLAAVSTIVAERKNLWSSAIIGGLWGLGHTVSLLAAGVLVLLFNFKISERLERALEFGVGLMLVFLGFNVLRKLFSGGKLHAHEHSHFGHKHAHPHIHAAHEKIAPHSHHDFAFNPRAVIVGLIHGLAGSAALMLLIVQEIESRWLGLLYIIVFGAGSIGGMMLMSFVIGLPLQLSAGRNKQLNLILQTVAGLASVIIGSLIAFEKAFTEGFIASLIIFF